MWGASRHDLLHQLSLLKPIIDHCMPVCYLGTGDIRGGGYTPLLCSSFIPFPSWSIPPLVGLVGHAIMGQPPDVGALQLHLHILLQVAPPPVMFPSP